MRRERRLAARWLRKTAGAVDFMDYGKGTNPRTIFNQLVEDARYESGHGGYSGTIAEKDGFKIRSRNPLPMKEAREFAYDELDDNPKWGPAWAIPVGKDNRIEGWLFYGLASS